MRRWLAILLLTLLPIQFSWAAVASYCGHEATGKTQHVGHHEHQHHADAGANTSKSADGQKAADGVDLDCGHCHGTCAAMLHPQEAVLALVSTSRPAALADALERAHAPTPPERPQWVSLA